MVKVNTGKGIVIPDGEATVLSQMCQVVIDRLNERGLAIQPGSRFSQELDEIEIQERREWLGEYISSSSTALLLSVIEMVIAIEQSLASEGCAVDPYIVLRSIMEHTYKIVYLTDGGIEANERIRRALRTYYAEMQEYQKLSERRRVNSTDPRFVHIKGLITKWYRDLTGKRIPSRLTAREIIEAGQKLTSDGWIKGAPGVNETTYQSLYRISSGVVHGNLWALANFCMRTVPQGPTKPKLIIPFAGLDRETTHLMRICAGRLLQFAFGFTVQLHDIIPAGEMNRIGHLEALHLLGDWSSTTH